MTVFNNKFGVPHQNEAEDGAFEHSSSTLQPKLKLRYRILTARFGSYGNTDTIGSQDFGRNVQSVQRPGGQHDEVQVDSFNSRAYLPGRWVWNPVQMTMRDDVDGNVATLISGQLQKQNDFYNQTAWLQRKNAPVGGGGHSFKFNMQISYLDGDGYSMETWNLLGCFLQTIDNDQYDFSANEPMQNILTVRYDNAWLAGEGPMAPSDIESQENLFKDTYTRRGPNDGPGTGRGRQNSPIG